jgi:hypothetical protein
VLAFAARRVKERARFDAMKRLFLAVAVSLGALASLGAGVPASDSSPSLQPQPQAMPRARVFIAENRAAVVSFNPQPAAVDALFNQGLLAFTGKASREDAWRSLVSTQDVVGVKVVSAPGAQSGTRPAVVGAAVRGLLAAGVPHAQIVIWDKSLVDLRRSGFVRLADELGVSVAGAVEEGYDDEAVREIPLLGKLVWGDHEFGKFVEGAGRRSFVSRLLTRRLTKIVNITPLLNHNLAGVSGNLYTLAMDSMDNTIRFELSPEHLPQAVPEFYALEQVGDKAVLHVTDALLCQYLGEERTLLQYSTMLGQLRFSTDPIALDLLSMQEIERQREAAKITTPRPVRAIYTNAALLEIGVADLKHVDTTTLR